MAGEKVRLRYKPNGISERFASPESWCCLRPRRTEKSSRAEWFWLAFTKETAEDSPPTVMVKYLNGLVLAIGITVFGIGFLYFFGKTAIVTGTKTDSGRADFKYIDERLWGLVQSEGEIKNVEEIAWVNVPRRRRGREFASFRVQLVSTTEEYFPKFGSKFGTYRVKGAGEEMRNRMRDFLADDEQPSYFHRIPSRNDVFFWAGFLLFISGSIFVFMQTTGIIYVLVKKL